MFNKETVFEINSDNTAIIDINTLTKTASFSLPEGQKYDPDFLYVLTKAVSAGEYYGANKNNDYFPEEELKSGYPTFLTAHFFKNHENKDVANAIGTPIAVDWDDKMKCVKVLVKIDRKIAPSIVRGFETGTITDVSMGCRVDHSVCSICGNKAKTKMDFCNHILYDRGKIYDDGKMVYEINMSPKFHDLSAVLNGAEKTAKAIDLKLNQDGNKIKNSQKVSAQEWDETLIEKIAYDKSTSQSFLNINMEKILEKLGKYDQCTNDIYTLVKNASIEIVNDSIINDNSTLKDRNITTFKTMTGIFLSEEDCINIGISLNQISQDNNCKIGDVFGEFLKISDYAGISFSPLEIYYIYCGLTQKSVNDKILDIKNETLDFNKNDIFPFLPSDIISKISPIPNEAFMESRPVTRIKLVVMKMPNNNVPQNPSWSNDLVPLISSLAPAKSDLPMFLKHRLNKFANEETHIVHLEQYAPLHYVRNEKMIKNAFDLDFGIAGLIWQSYQTQRIENAKIKSNFYEKLAHLILLDHISLEKTAKISGTWKASLASVPLTYAYSSFQRSRIRNGKDVSSANRYIAENPDQAAAGAFLGIQGISRGVKSQKNKIQQNKLQKQLSKSAGLENLFQKNKATTETEIDFITKNGYTQKQAEVLRDSIIFTCSGDQSQSDEILEKNALNENDVEKYLQIVDKFIRIEHDKIASTIDDLCLIHPNNSLDEILPVFIQIHS